MRKLVFIGAVLLLSLTACLQKDISREKAKRIIIDEILKPDMLDHSVMVFLTSEVLAKGSRISPMGFPEKTEEIKSSTWFAWIDDDPDAEFAHETRFVFLNAKRGKYLIKVENWYPVLNDTEVLWKDISKWISDDLLIFAKPAFSFDEQEDTNPIHR